MTDTWDHDCPEEGHIGVGKGEVCNWCGATEPAERRVGPSQQVPDTGSWDPGVAPVSAPRNS